MAAEVAVIGHVEWVTHGRSPVPTRVGSIIQLHDVVREPGGGAGVAARILAGLGARPRLLTSLADDDGGELAAAILEREGVEVLAARHAGPQAEVLTVTEPDGERTLFIVGENRFPRRADPLPWSEIADCVAIFFAGGDPAALVAARAAKTLVVAARQITTLAASGVRADVVVGSVNDPDDSFDPADLHVPPDVVVLTDGARGGSYRSRDGRDGWWQAVVPPGPIIDTFGAGDSFMGALAWRLGAGEGLDAAISVAAAVAAEQLTRRGGEPRPV